MYISELKLENFRKYKNLNIKFNEGLNVIVGENNSGKTAIIDAMRILLGTQGNEFYRVEREDFYCNNGKYENEFKITCYIRGINEKEGGMFLEFLSFEEKNENCINAEYCPYIKIETIAKYKENKIFFDTFIGDIKDDIGYRIPGEIKEFFKVVFLKPLRDAENQMVAKKNSRLAQILLNFDSDILKDDDNNELVEIIKEANKSIKLKTSKIKVKPIGQENEISIIELINDFIEQMNAGDVQSNSDFKIKDNSLKEILERVSIEFDSPKEGLGIENLLFTAVEFLLLKNSSYFGLKTVLIEEIEAHLHPQTQLNLINYLTENYSKKEHGQIIMTTHSPNITSKVNIENLLICKDNNVYNMGEKYTNLEKGDYRFLSRFLDVTKANLFFAKKLIFVEGDAENLLIPVLAKIILGKTLESEGISVINVGNTAFLRYSRIFQRKDESEFFNIKIAIITDLDVRRKKNKDGKWIETEKQLIEREERTKKEKESYYDYKNNIRTFVSPKRTLEYCIAMGKYRKLLLQSIYEAEKEQNSNKYPDAVKKKIGCKENAEKYLEKNKGLDDNELARKIYEEEMLDKKVSKAITAQILAEKIESEYNLKETIEEKQKYKEELKKDDKIKYLIDAIEFVGEENE